MPERRLDAAKRAAKQEALLRAAHTQSMENRKHAVRDALEMGVTRDELAKALGVTIRRVVQLAEGN